MGLLKTVPTNRGADAYYWRATNFNLDTINPTAPVARFTLSGYPSKAVYETPGTLPLVQFEEIIYPEDLIPILGAEQATFAAVAAVIDGWVRDRMHYHTVQDENPDFNPAQPESETNPRYKETVVPGPWAGGEIV